MKSNRLFFIIFFSMLFYFSLPVALNANVFTYHQSFNGTPSFTNTFTFEKWYNPYDPASTLTSVTITIDLDIFGGYLVVDNDGADPATVTSELGAKITISSTDVPLLDSSFQPVAGPLEVVNSATFNLEGDNGDGTGNVDATAPDGDTLVGESKSGTDSGNIAAMFLSNYTASTPGDTFDIVAIIDQIMNLGSTGGVEGSFLPVSVTGGITLTYTDNSVVPEPSTMLLLGTGIMFIAGTIRRRYS